MSTHVLNFVGAEAGGALTYAQNFCRELTQLQTKHRFVVLLCERGWHKGRWFLGAPNVEYRVFHWPKLSFLHRLYFDQQVVRNIARETRADALYSQVFAARRFRGKQVLTLRNAIYFSQLYYERARATRSLTKRIEFRLRRAWTRWSIRQADTVVAPTRSMLDEARKQNSLDGKRWQVVHHGFDRQAFLCGPPLNTRQQVILDRMDEGVLKVLYVSPFREHKNVDVLFEGFHLYRERGGKGQLVVTFCKERLGAADATRSRRAYERCGLGNDVIFLGSVPWREIHDLYAQCEVFVFPSYLESFGFPLVEAMSMGLPILASDTNVNREVCQDAAIYFSTFASEELAARLVELERNEALRKSLGERGKCRCLRFSWREHVRQVVKLLSEAS